VGPSGRSIASSLQAVDHVGIAPASILAQPLLVVQVIAGATTMPPTRKSKALACAMLLHLDTKLPHNADLHHFGLGQHLDVGWLVTP